MKLKAIFALSFFQILTLPASAQSTRLHYDSPAIYFEEALPIGNGSQGAMIYGGVAEERISLNDITLWTGEPDRVVYSPDAYKSIAGIREALFREDYREADRLQRAVQGHYSQNYQPLGTLIISQSEYSDTSEYSRSLDIARALATVNYRGCSREYFASAPDSVMVVRMKGKKQNLTLGYHCQLPHQQVATVSKESVAELTIDGYAAWTSKPNYAGGETGFQYDSNRGVHFRTIIRVLNQDGTVRVRNNDQLQLADCTDCIILIANATSFNGNDKDPVREGRDYKSLVRSRIDHAAAKTYDELLNRHEADYQSYFNRISLDLGTTAADIQAKTTEQQLRDYTEKNEENPDLEELYFNYGRYLLISCSRTQGVPANLQGLWNERILPPWSCNYTSNINVEENYWPAEAAGLGDMHLSLIDFVRKLPVTGTETARAYYGVQQGWCLAHNTDIWGMTCPVGEHGGDPMWANWNMGGAWISTHLWEHYAFTMNLDYLRDVYPVLKGAADFCLAWLVEKDGCLLTAPATSPENTFLTPDGYAGRTLYGGFADIAMIRECLTDTRMAALLVGESKSYIETLEKTLQRLLPYRIGKNGHLQEWYHDWPDQDPHHRHQSHLFGLYPGNHITLAETPQLAAACKRTLEIKGDKTTGWSTGWRVNLQARLHEAEAAYHIYRVLLNYISPDDYRGPGRRTGGGTYPNLLDAHSPFQIDGNFGGCAGVMEMLVQSTLNETQQPQITLLPALPKAWSRSGTLKGIHTRGGYTLDFSWQNGFLTTLFLHDCRPASARPQKVFLRQGTKTWKLTTRAGETVRLK
ncbi:MAG: glycoside hydrolase family 95 protein [Bacteroidaceae bacterium]|nr:glycoside hydrolase family 95 protein [Bacteroidaceae bacterium]